MSRKRIMTPLEKLAEQMKSDWDRRVGHDYRFWMGEGHLDDGRMWETGSKDFFDLAEGIRGGPTSVALEIGCGVGRMMKAASERFGRVIGIDVSRLAIAKARELIGLTPKIDLVVGSGVDLAPVESHSVDFVWSYAAIACMPIPVIANYLIEIKRVLKVDGIARLQLYLGQEMLVHEHDTLHLRSFSPENLANAAALAGFSCSVCWERVVGDAGGENLGLNNCLVQLAPTAAVAASPEQIAKALLPSGESRASKEVNPNALEAWMALNYAEALADDGEAQKAKEAVEYVVANCQSATIDTQDILARVLSKATTGLVPTAAASVRSHSSHDAMFEDNLAVLRERFPTVHAHMTAVSDRDSSHITVRHSKDGPILFAADTCLDHAEKPLAAGEAWVRRALIEERIKGAQQVVVVGFGGGYHLQALLEMSAVPVACCEPDTFALREAMRVRDLRPVLTKLSHLCVGEEIRPLDMPSEGEVLTRPQTAITNPKYIDTLKAIFYSKRGLSELRPKIGVLGPFHGGTLPTATYTCQALQRMGQRVRGVDVSGFNDGYMILDRFIKNDLRQGMMRGQYVEFVSQVLLETFHEKPVDILICMAQAPISAKALMELRSRGVITVLWFVEDYLRFTYWREMAKHYDFVFTIQKGECIEKMKAAGAGEVHYLPTACDPSFHQPLRLSEEDKERWGSPISFVGAGYHNRVQAFAGLANYPFKIWGSEWPAAKPFDRLVQEDSRRVKPEEYVKIFNATDININLHSSSERDGVDPSGDFVNPRTFELAACGAFQLCDERSLLPELFEVGDEIITFSTLEEMREQIEYYLAHPEERNAVCERARARILRDHSYDRRLEQMLSIVYATKYDTLRQRESTSPWSEMIRRADHDPELKERCIKAMDRGEEPALDALIADIVTGQGKLTETEQKLLFMHHVKSQIVRMRSEESGVRK
jgi:spore maturation protein CgeB